MVVLVDVLQLLSAVFDMGSASVIQYWLLADVGLGTKALVAFYQMINIAIHFEEVSYCYKSSIFLTLIKLITYIIIN